jgi:hypothetical protein
MPESSIRLVSVSALYITPAKSQPMLDVAQVEAVAGRGLVGDRYYLGTGYYSGKPGWGANVTLLAAEAIDAINAGHGQHFTGAILRRNIVTRGLDVETLIGREFRLGTAVRHGRAARTQALSSVPALGRTLRRAGVDQVLGALRRDWRRGGRERRDCGGGHH